MDCMKFTSSSANKIPHYLGVSGVLVSKTTDPLFLTKGMAVPDLCYGWPSYDVLNKIRDYVLTKKDNQEFRQKMVDQYYALMKENGEGEEAAECMKEQEEPPTCYFSYTSNVDGLFLKSGLRPKELLEIHGSCLRFQCPEGSESNHPLVRVPESFHIELDPKTLLATNAGM